MRIVYFYVTKKDSSLRFASFGITINRMEEMKAGNESFREDAVNLA
mgnify:CR=1 FL=1